MVIVMLQTHPNIENIDNGGANAKKGFNYHQLPILVVIGITVLKLVLSIGILIMLLLIVIVISAVT